MRGVLVRVLMGASEGVLEGGERICKSEGVSEVS